MTAEIRPRTSWEAIDLGVSLVRAHAGALLKGWMASVYPICLLILALSWNSIGWGVFLIWWLKPVWERVALHPLSRSLFGEHPTWRETMKVLPSELLKSKGLVIIGLSLALCGAFIGSLEDRNDVAGLTALLWLSIIGLLFYRSGLSRSLVLPVRYLEGLSGTQGKARIQVLSSRSSSSAVGLTFICLLMELCLFVSQLWFFFMMMPEGIDLWGMFPLDGFYGDEFEMIPKWMIMMLAIFYLNALSIVAWFYTGGGFGLYVNTRTWTEGWDIELKFKGLGQRIGILILALGFFGSAPKLAANQDAQQILEREEFQVQTRDIYRGKKKDSSDSGSSFSAEVGTGAFGAIGNLLFWIIVCVLVVWVIWVIVANAHLFRKDGISEPAEDKKKVTTVAGLNVEPENLPSNLLETARRLWEDGKYQESLGLLYRGAISSLVSDRVVEIEESDTEMTCLRRVDKKGESAHASYFKVLTRAWMGQAYARRLPDEETLAVLWSKWPFRERRKL